ncbi:type II secretion system F family protein [Desulfotomaculum varum]
MSILFKYKAKKITGRTVRGRITAASKYEAIQALRQQRLFIIEINATASDRPWLSGFVGPKFNLKELSLFCRQFATLTAAGIPVIQGLSILLAQAENRSLQHALAGVIENLQAGQTLSQSLACQPRLFPPVVIHMAEAGEISGSLDDLLTRLADYLEKYYDLSEKYKSALAYPVFILLLALVVVGLMLVFVLPAFTRVLQDLQAPVPAATAFVMKTGELLRHYWYVGLPAGLFTAVLGKILVSGPGGQQLKERVTLKLPIYGPLIKKINLLRLCRTLAVLLNSGIPLLRCLLVLQNSAPNSAVNRAVRVAADGIREGQGLAVSLQQSGWWPPLAIRMIQVGEETGELPLMLDKVAGFYEKEIYQTLNRLTALTEPLLICLVGGLVSLLMLSVLLPILSIMDALP